jgi:integrase
MTTHKNNWAERQFRDSRIGRSPGSCFLPRDASALWVAFQLRPLCKLGGNHELHTNHPARLRWRLEKGDLMQFQTLCREYLCYSRSNKTPKSYDRDVLSTKHLTRRFARREIRKITAKMVEKYKDERLQAVKPATINRELSCMKHMYTKALHWGYLKCNPLIYVKKFKEPPGRVCYLKPNELNALLAKCSEHLKPIVVTALNTGMRKSEILNLQWHDVDLDNRTIILRQTKNNQVRVIPINVTLHKQLVRLRSQRNGSPFVFTTTKGTPYTTITKIFKRAIHRAGIYDFRFHDLRHTFASYLVMSGVNIRVVQELLGHKTLAMTLRYSHLSNAQLRNAVEKLAVIEQSIERKMPGRRIELRTPGFSVRCSTN